jgi:Leucine-rich repeat (LRR) protein
MANTSEKVLSRINQSKSFGGSILDLGGLGLPKVPEEIFELTQLKVLYLGHSGRRFQHPNAITTLPSEFFDSLRNLEVLNLVNIQLIEIPEAISQLTNLKELFLDNNRIGVLPNCIGTLNNLERLSLNNNSLSDLPESIGDLAHLKRLSLNNNNLTTLPESIGRLTNLERLSLNKNLLTVLPESICELTRLQRLSLNNLALSTLPLGICRLHNLELLALNYNRLSELPEDIGKLTHLKRLWLDYNILKELPESMGDLKNLQRFSVEWNRLKRIPKSVEHLLCYKTHFHDLKFQICPLKEASLACARRISDILIWVSFAICFVAIFSSPEFSAGSIFYLLLVSFLVGLPLIAVGLAIRWKDYFCIIKVNDYVVDRTLDLVIPFALSSATLALFASAKINTFDWQRVLLFGVIFGLTAGLATLGDSSSFTLGRNSPKVWAYTKRLFFSVLWGIGVTIYFNQLFDKGHPTIFQAPITEKITEYHSGVRYHRLRIGPWGPKTDSEKIDIPFNIYNTVSVGQAICVKLYRGALTARWYQVSLCPPT